jgi:hypothetical protein
MTLSRVNSEFLNTRMTKVERMEKRERVPDEKGVKGFSEERRRRVAQV